MATQSSTPSGNASSSGPRPVVIGLYGIPGCGKSFILKQLLSHKFDYRTRISCYEGSQVIASQIPGGIDAFEALSGAKKRAIREAAVKLIPLSLATSPDTILRNREEDTERKRATVLTQHLKNWQELEMSELRDAYYETGILFSVVSGPREDPTHYIIPRIASFEHQSECVCQQAALGELEQIVNDSAKAAQLKTALVFDADKTLAAEDSGMLFWQSFAKINPDVNENALKAIFRSKLQYSYAAFRQAMALPADVTDDGLFNLLCDSIAGKIRRYRDIRGLLREAVEHEHVLPIVVTCGLHRVWDTVLHREGLSGRVRVMGGGRLDDFLITPETKAEVVDNLQNAYGLKVWALGDSPLDIPMLRKVDHAIIVVGVVGDQETRSKSMDAVLLESGIQDRQVLMDTVHPRLDTTSLPIVQLTDEKLIESIVGRRSGSRVLHATTRAAATLLMTPTRDSTVAGPKLREAHRQAGLYLATQFVAEVIGLDTISIPHVQGRQTDGYRLRQEDRTLIVALMRAGEPMALGVNDAFPLAKFRHAKEPDDIAVQHVAGASTILLVDAVVNNGDTAAKLIKRIRGLAPDVWVLVVAGVLQSQCVSATSGNKFVVLHEGDANLTLVALRISENKFKGVGGTDTGNKLFNTTHLD